jgi:hypothetical protein
LTLRPAPRRAEARRDLTQRSVEPSARFVRRMDALSPPFTPDAAAVAGPAAQAVAQKYVTPRDHQVDLPGNEVDTSPGSADNDRHRLVAPFATAIALPG